MRKNKIKSLVGVFLIIFFFIIASYIAQNYVKELQEYIGAGFVGMILYIDILVIATVIAPLNAVPLLPVASVLWGWFFAGLLSIAGWTLGALIAFSLARRYGAPLVRKFSSLEQIEKYEKLIPKENIFLSIVFLRIAVPVDILSYLLGLFSHIPLSTYLIATLIGISPFAFIFAYVGTLPLYYQIIAFVTAIIIILIGHFIGRNIKNGAKNN